MKDQVPSLCNTFLRQQADGLCERLPVDDSFWPRLMSGELGTFQHESLISALSFDKSWDQWELHPAGDEIVVLISGSADLLVEMADQVTPHVTSLREPGQFALVAKGSWHTADIHCPSLLLFITPGEGTQGKARQS